MRRSVAVLAVSVVFISACGKDDDPWTYGTVVQQDFDPAHIVHHPPSWRDDGQDCNVEYSYDWFSGDWRPKTVCRDRPDVYVPAWDEHVPDRWRVLVIEDSDGNDASPEEHWFTVAESVYDDCRVGRRYDRELKECPPR